MSSRVDISSTRPLLRGFPSRVLSRLRGLPPPVTNYRVLRGVRVPMRDGIDLVADHYAPMTNSPAGTLLVRGPYGRGFPFSTQLAAPYAARGYHVVLQSVRGTFGSGGNFEPMIHELRDGSDTAAWLREQPWYTGSFATIGLSYLGFTQWALLADPPTDMKAAVITAGPHDFSASVWVNGAFALNDFLGWSDMVAHQEDHHRLRVTVRQLRAPHWVARAADELPLGEGCRELLGTGAPWYQSWLAHPDVDDSFWDQTRHPDALDRVEIPVLLIGAWQDLFIGQTIAQFRHLHARGIKPALTVGPWTHADIVQKGSAVVIRETLDWLRTHLGGDTDSRPTVRAYVNNHGWIGLEDWPPDLGAKTLFLQPSGGLGEDAPDAGVPPVTFTYDPSSPTPTVGGPILFPRAGYRNDTELGRRADVATFTGDELTEDLYVLGAPSVELQHSCDTSHHDLFVRLSEVDSSGRSRNVTDGIQRFRTRDSTSRCVRVELDPVAHRFAAGSRIRLMVAGGSHPRFARNLGTGEPAASGIRMTSSQHTVYLGGVEPSRLSLPANSHLPSGGNVHGR